MYQDIYNCICQSTKKIRFIIHYVKPTAQLLFKIQCPKGGPTCRRQVVNPRHQTPQGQSVTKPETPLQGQKHPGRWGMVEHQIPSIKMFKTNTKSHKHPSIRFFIKERDTIDKPKRTKSGIQLRNRALPYRTWWGAASPILNDTPIV